LVFELELELDEVVFVEEVLVDVLPVLVLLVALLAALVALEVVFWVVV
jgi:hypothetical protein